MNDGIVNVFVPYGDDAGALRTLFSEWTAAGLLRSSLWVTTDDNDDEATTTTLITASGTTSVDLLDALAAHPLHTVRVVTVRLPATGAVRPHTGATVAERVRRALAPHQRCEQLNVVIPTSDGPPLPATVFVPIAATHVLVSPEDRRSDTHVSRGVTAGATLVPHAAAATATVSGAWTLQSTAPFDGEHFGSSNEQPHVRTVRGFVRLVTAADMTDQVTRAVFAGRRTAAWTALAVDAIATDDPHGVAGSLRQQVQKKEPMLSCAPFTGSRRPPVRTISRWAALRLMLRFIAQRTRELPARVSGRVTSTANRAADDLVQRVVFGDLSRMRVSGRRPGRGAAGHDDATPDTPGVGAARDATPPATGGVWRTLRAVTFGALDAGPFPDGIEPPTDGAYRQIITDLDAVIAAPDAEPFQLGLNADSPHTTLPAWASAPISATDAASVRRLRELLTERHSEAARGGPARVSEDGTEVPAVPRDTDAAKELAEAIEQLDAFVEQHDGSLWWRIGADLGDERQAATQRFSEARKAADRTDAAVAQAQITAAQQRLARLWGTGLATALVIVVGGHLLRRFDVAFPQWQTITLVSLTVLMAWWCFAFVPYQRKMFRIMYGLNRRHWDYRNAVAAADHYDHEVARLESMCGQFREWAQVMSYLVHRPEGELDAASNEDSGEALTVPLAVGVAIGEPDDLALQRASAIVGREVFGRGWLSELYVRFLRSTMRDLKHLRGLDASARDPDPDSEIVGPSPRAYLRDRLMASDHADEWRDEVRQRVARALRGLPLDELFNRVLTGDQAAADAAWGDGAPTSAGPFVSQILPVKRDAEEQSLSEWVWSTSARLTAAETIERSLVWSTLPVRDGASTRVMDVQPTNPTLGSDRYWAQSIRLDVTQPCPVTDFAIVHRDEEAAGDEQVAQLEQEIW